ncbi:hypothetical protein FSP39_011030, partial [Pinctada imbricata]
IFKGKVNKASLFPQESDVVIVGGGLVGSAVAYFLRTIPFHQDAFKVTVIERDPMYTQSSSMLSVGGIRHQFSLPENIQMSLFTTEFLRNIKLHLSLFGWCEVLLTLALNEVTSQCRKIENLGYIDEDPPDVQFNHHGYMFLATEEKADRLQELVEMQRDLGAQTKLYSKEMLATEFPWLNLDDVALGSVGQYGEGWFDPWSLLKALKQKNISLGVRYCDAEVIGFNRDEINNMNSYPKLTEIKLKDRDGDRFDIKFMFCVNCAGAWSGEVARMAGVGTEMDPLRVSLPVEPRKRYVYVAHCPEGPGLSAPLTVDTTGAYFRREGLGGCYLMGASPDSEDFEPDSSNLDVDYDFFMETVWPRLAYRVPTFEKLKVMESEEFMLLPVNQLVDIISSDELNVRNEEQVYTAVMGWVKYNIQDRRQHLSLVVQHVRLPLMSPKFLVGTVGSDLLIKSDDTCRDLLDEAKNYLLLPQERPLMQGPRTRPRKPIRCGEVLYAVGGWCSGDAISSVEKFDPQTSEWRMVAPMSKRRCGVGVAVLNDLLYAVGGHDGQSYLNSIERFDPQTNQWSGDVAPTSSCRTSVGVAVLENYMYAVGGQDGVSCLNFVERYDPQLNKWTKVASMSTRRLGVGVAVLGGFLYAVGGSDGTSPLNTVERYDPRTNRWTPVSPMGTRRKHLGVAVFNNMIYAVGGRDDTTELSSAERYNPQTNTWQPVVAMTSRRSGVGLAVVNGQLMAIGGFDGTTYLKTIEVFDAETNCWKLVSGMNYRRLGGGVGVVRMPQHESHLW